ncbi:MBL fold metallo-hydrolase [Kitasatospora sp. NPDC059571]|uniref:MBL fold metallo-hydrolase n=1 Tax=Kitasatospora sp. NPDC059571 TaxID=3346871 RepID=UPI0036C6774E
MPHPPLDVRWIHGSPSAKHNTDPDIQVYAHDPDTYVLRQNKAVHYEAPFLFLLLGDERALLLDTGATADPAHFPLRRTVDALLAPRLAERPGYRLLVAHTHGHGDHVAGDGQFADRPATEVVPAEQGLARFGLDGERTAELDLGGRRLECLATPGHHPHSVTWFDPRTGFLLTGDTVYPGRLYVDDWPAFTRTVDRLVDFADDRPVTHVLGCHIEMTSEPGVDYPIRTTHQPDEPPLELSVADLHDLRRACREIGDRPGRHPYPRFVVCKPD